MEEHPSVIQDHHPGCAQTAPVPRRCLFLGNRGDINNVPEPVRTGSGGENTGLGKVLLDVPDTDPPNECNTETKDEAKTIPHHNPDNASCERHHRGP